MPVGDPWKMKKFTQVESKIRQDLNEQNAKDELRPMANRTRTGFNNQGPRAASGPRLGNSQTRASHLLNAGGNIIGGIGTKKSFGAGGLMRNSSYTGRQSGLANNSGPSLNKGMLDSLNSQNKVMKKTGKFDHIEAAIHLRASRGELKTMKNVSGQAD